MTAPVLAHAALSGIPSGLRQPLLDEYNKLARNYRESRWEPAELNGGKVCEIVYSILKGHVDASFPASPSKPNNMVDACRNLENASGFPRSVRIQIPRLLMALYEIRNQRNVGHVGADVDPNHMDATVVFSMVKWIMAELVRIFHGVTTEEATQIVESLSDRTIPIIWQVGGLTKVLGGLTAKEKTLVLLHSSAGPLAVRSLVASLEYANISQYRSTILKPLHKKQLVHYDAGAETVAISPLGVRHVEEHIPLDL